MTSRITREEADALKAAAIERNESILRAHSARAAAWTRAENERARQESSEREARRVERMRLGCPWWRSATEAERRGAIFLMVADGASFAEIGRALGISFQRATSIYRATAAGIDGMADWWFRPTKGEA